MEPNNEGDNQKTPNPYRTFSARLRRDVPSEGVNNQPDEFVLTDVAVQRLREHLENRVLERGPGMETFQREVQGTWPAPTDDQVDAIRVALDTLGRSPLQTLPSGVSIVPDNRFSTPSSALYGAFNVEHSMSPDSGRSLIPLGRYVFNLMELRPDHARKCEEDERLWDLVSAYLDNQFQMWRLGIIADNLEDNGFPSDDIRLVIMRKQPSLWCVSWWPTCLRKDGA